jgi:WD40 repeat protein
VISPDGADLAVAGSSALEIVDLDTGESRPSGDTITGSESEKLLLVYSADGRRVVSTDLSVALSLWDARTAEHLGTVQAAGGAASPAFLPDNRTVRIADEDGAIYEWDTSLTHAVESACRIVRRNLTEAEWNGILPNEPYQRTCPDR